MTIYVKNISDLQKSQLKCRKFTRLSPIINYLNYNNKIILTAQHCSYFFQREALYS